MDSAKAAVKDFMAKSGHHDTTVHEKVAPAVTHETINRVEHEDVQTATDKEVHQDHYHTSVQPIHHTEQLKEQHHHNIVPVEHRQYEHDNPEQVQAKLAAEQQKFRDEAQRVEGQRTSSVAPVVAGEHIHHHVHETIQPVVNKQTIEPHVVHTTVPIHEVHHNAAQHHSTSALPAVSLADFKKQGGVLSGREERYDGFEGEPRSVGGALGSGTHESSSMGASGLEGRSTDQFGSNTSGTSGLGHGHTGTNEATGTTGKPSMMEKLNPKVDSNGDGKAGFMK
ncbi:hypothetical protein LTR36_003849 [Oleoguttula mirabilis]|uniref:Allergen n=1 Tax=Oleoguttula mirabilis TaxID=1507867 RepID=A0AAV9JHR1_9PEZI|nr:hypothetical protein LTR36_003849 [Oleoguttula mirabilis]